MTIFEESILLYCKSTQFYMPIEIMKIIRSFLYFDINDKNITIAVDEWQENKKNALILYGHISHWDTSMVTDMSNLFLLCCGFNDDIQYWDVSNVQNMESMFHGAINFNKSIMCWDVGNVKNMKCVFYSAESFNQNINDWNVSNVENMAYMFYNAASFTQNINN